MNIFAVAIVMVRLISGDVYREISPCSRRLTYR